MTEKQRKRLEQLEYDYDMGMCQFWNEDVYEEWFTLLSLKEDEENN